MTNRSKQKGTRFETACTSYLQSCLIDCHRETLHGSTDLGDISLTVSGQTVAVECKAVKHPNTAQQIREARREADNLDTMWWLLIRKRPGVGMETPERMGQQEVITDWATFCFLTGNQAISGRDTERRQTLAMSLMPVARLIASHSTVQGEHR